MERNRGMATIWRKIKFVATLIVLMGFVGGQSALADSAWSAGFDFKNHLQQWKEAHAGKQIKVDWRREKTSSGFAAVLTVPQETPTTASMVRTINLPAADRGVLIKFSGEYQADMNAAVQAVIQPLGGKESGNGDWQTQPLKSKTTGWVPFAIYRTLPTDSTKISVRLMVLRGSGTLRLRNAEVAFMSSSDLPDFETVRLTPSEKHAAGQVTPFHLGVNVAFWFPGVYYGTLPPSNSDSNRSAFIAELQRAGVRSARFPGGTISHYYLAEGKQYTDEVLALLKRGKTKNVSMEWPKGHYPEWSNVRDALREAGIKIIYELNTSFYVDAQGSLRPICDTKYPKAAGLADGKEHYEEAAAALHRLFDNGTFRPGDVDYWEMGNEEFGKMDVEQYANIVAAYTRVLKKRDPKTPICYTGHWEVEPLLEELGVMDDLTGVTFHYPYSRWPGPSPKIATADYESFSRTDMAITKHLDRFAAKQQSGRFPSHLKRTISETGVYKYWNYDPFRMTCSFAHALAYANNWPQLMSHPSVDMATYHELESPFFGQIMYHMEFDPIARRWDWMDPNVRPQSVDMDYQGGGSARLKVRRPKTYMSMPTTRVMNMLSRFDGATVRLMDISPSGKVVQAMIGMKGAKTMLFLSSPADHPVRVVMDWPDDRPTVSRGTWTLLESDSVYAVLESEYRERLISAPMPKEGRLDILLPARSVSLFEWEGE